MKRITGILLATLLCVSLLPAISLASESDLADFDISNGTLEKYTGATAEVVIPKDRNITAIGAEAFKDNTTIVSVDIPEGILSIGDDAFSGCDSLTTVRLPDSLETISAWAFGSCTKLSEINLPPRLSHIGEWAFYLCRQLGAIEIPASVTDIGQRAFQIAGSENPSFAVTFAERTAADTLTLGAGTFESCSTLEKLDLPEGLIVIPDTLCCDCDSLSFVSIPLSVTTIGKYAFMRCRSLPFVSLPSEVTSVPDQGYGAFYDCANLKTMSVAPSNFDNGGSPVPGTVTTLYFRGTEAEYRALGLNLSGVEVLCVPESEGVPFVGYWENSGSGCATVSAASGTDKTFMIDCDADVTIPASKTLAVLNIEGGTVTKAKNAGELPISLSMNIQLDQKDAHFIWDGSAWTPRIMEAAVTVGCSPNPPDDAWYKDAYDDDAIKTYPFGFDSTWRRQEGFQIVDDTGGGSTCTVRLNAPMRLTYLIIGRAAPASSTKEVTLECAAVPLGADSLGASGRLAIPVTVMSLALDQKELALCEGWSAQLEAISSNLGENPSITWESSNEAVAAVEGDGETARITGQAEGNAMITARSGNCSAQCEVTVIKAPSISLLPDTLTLNENDSETITAVVDPENAPVTLEWFSDNPAAASVSGSGTTAIVKGISPGVATITAQAGTATATCTVTVTAPAILPTSAPPTVTTTPTQKPSDEPEEPSDSPTDEPTDEPSGEPSGEPTAAPTERPTHTAQPSGGPTRPTDGGTGSATPSVRPTSRPTGRPTYTPSASASSGTSSAPSPSASSSSTPGSSGVPSSKPTQEVSPVPSALPEATSTIAGGTISVTNPDSGYEFEVTDSYTAIEGTIGAYDEAECTDVAQILSELTVPEGTLVVCRDADGSRIADTVMACTGQTITFLDAASGREIASIVVVVKGDVTGDGVVNIVDIVFTAQAVNGERSLEGPYFLAADMTDNGTIDIPDLTQMARIITDP